MGILSVCNIGKKSVPPGATLHSKWMEGRLKETMQKNVFAENGINACLDCLEKMRRTTEDLLNIHSQVGKSDLRSMGILERQRNITIEVLKTDLKNFEDNWGSREFPFIGVLEKDISLIVDTKTENERVKATMSLMEDIAKTFNHLKGYLSGNQRINRDLNSLNARQKAMRDELERWSP